MEAEEETSSGSPPPSPPPPPPPGEYPCTKGKASASTSRREPKDLVRMERSRREKMSEFYALLQSIVPNMFPKATRARVIDETVAYIRYLEEMIVHMEEKRCRVQVRGPERAAVNRGGSVHVTVHGRAAFFGLQAEARPGVVSRILRAFELRNAEVLNASVTTADGTVNMAVTAEIVEEANALERLKEDLLVMLEDHI